MLLTDTCFTPKLRMYDEHDGSRNQESLLPRLYDVIGSQGHMTSAMYWSFTRWQQRLLCDVKTLQCVDKCTRMSKIYFVNSSKMRFNESMGITVGQYVCNTFIDNNYFDFKAICATVAPGYIITYTTVLKVPKYRDLIVTLPVPHFWLYPYGTTFAVIEYSQRISYTERILRQKHARSFWVAIIEVSRRIKRRMCTSHAVQSRCSGRAVTWCKNYCCGVTENLKIIM